MIRAAAWVLAVAAAVGCGKNGGGTKPTEGSSAGTGKPITAEAPPPAPRIDAAAADELVPIQTDEPSDRMVETAFAATVKLANGRCPDAPPETLNSSASGVARLDDSSVFGVACGDGDKDAWTIAVVKTDGAATTILGAKNITAGQLQLHKDMRASPTRRCIQYDTIDGFVMIKGFEFCAPVAGGPVTAVPPDVALSQPTKVLPPVPAPDGVVDQATTALISDTYTCSNATRQPADQAKLAVMDNDGLTLALSCGDADSHDMVIGLLQQQKSGAMQVLAYTIDLGTDRDEITRIRSDANLVCVDYTRRPRGQNNVFCVRRSP